jgi:hypothetical protein
MRNGGGHLLKTYNKLYTEYIVLHDYFCRGERLDETAEEDQKVYKNLMIGVLLP